MDKRLYIAETPYKRLDTFLSEQTDEFTRSRLKKLIESGQVCVDGTSSHMEDPAFQVKSDISLSLTTTRSAIAER